ncbi:MAG: fibronectin type III domain-containing protein [Thermoplasmata archaeon]|nr:fibronectin type III domain-containing protein [Thermoplasmata archaeon]
MANTFSTADGTTHSTTIAGLQDGQTHNYYVKCKDSSDNENTDDYTITLSIASADTQAPSTPTNLQATAKSSSQIDISWDTSTDDVGVAGYKIHRNDVHIGDSATTMFSDTGLTPSTTYIYTVSAYDAAGSESDHSISASITTLQLPTTPQSSDATTYDIVLLVLVAVLIILSLINMNATRKLKSELSEHTARHTQKEEEPLAESSPNQDDQGL